MLNAAAILVSASLLQCAPGPEIEKALAPFRERVFATATNSRGYPMQIRVNANTGTFTVLMFMPNDLTCVISGGTDFASSQRRIVPGNPL